MNLETFLRNFEQTADIGNGPLSSEIRPRVNLHFVEIVESLGGKTFAHGLYRVFRGDQILEATEAIHRAFPNSKDRATVFGYDWLGRHFAIDNGRLEGGEPSVTLFEIGAGEAMEIPATIVDFHNRELVEYSDDALALPFFDEWKSQHPQDIAATNCVGYKLPLFLGGSDTVDNLEMIDLSVYVETCGQLINKTRNLPHGQTIGNISIK